MGAFGKTLMVAAAFGLGLTAAANARDLRIASGAPPAHPSNGYLYKPFAEYLAEETNGELTTIELGTEVVGLGQMKDALQTGLVDVGNLLPLYFPAELPNFALAGELALTGKDAHAMSAALTEYTVTCSSCQDELSAFGMVYLGSGSSDQYALLTKTPVSNAEDVEGLRLRSGGAPYSRWAEHFGATPVSVSVLETFEAMSQGTIDGSMASIGDLLAFRLIELVENVTLLPLGTYFATSNLTTAAPTWASLSVEQREAMARAANRANADMAQRWGYDFPAIAEKAALEAGITIQEADPAFAEAAAEFAIADQQAAAAISAERFGMEDASERVEEFIRLVEKWEAISEEVGHDRDAIVERVWDEVWSKVDFATYGM
ncbi:TRAP-type C4-dicarboxylate transport system, substrate-binding protein [Pseudooceanicola antarcticus]|uniref:C4-dicarboxylate ABC transporter substrate-binding protein n=1 Tax=Pseudooceanicola antarcticus TaxID=1247613 RepID=A0A285JH18_9RHOB|nr:TRAP transporter substrate-binding protein DctP [Pseudooceanicola antarcticus]PJE26443.1 C4-dicarboxylate ABC transporter substrate-binding protein [Pseudooceanicola antarcticus]SNY59572.1 TRAP-type C4-dicarboxylate transport system, substrate-binding protein [Pseudooceanicola antarcticus]